MRRVSCCRCSRIFFTATCCASFRSRLLANTLTRSSIWDVCGRVAQKPSHSSKRIGNARARHKSVRTEQIRSFAGRCLIAVWQSESPPPAD